MGCSSYSAAGLTQAAFTAALLPGRASEIRPSYWLLPEVRAGDTPAMACVPSYCITIRRLEPKKLQVQLKIHHKKFVIVWSRVYKCDKTARGRARGRGYRRTPVPPRRGRPRSIPPTPPARIGIGHMKRIPNRSDTPTAQLRSDISERVQSHQVGRRSRRDVCQPCCMHSHTPDTCTLTYPYLYTSRDFVHMLAQRDQRLLVARFSRWTGRCGAQPG